MRTFKFLIIAFLLSYQSLATDGPTFTPFSTNGETTIFGEEKRGVKRGREEEKEKEEEEEEEEQAKSAAPLRKLEEEKPLKKARTFLDRFLRPDSPANDAIYLLVVTDGAEDKQFVVPEEKRIDMKALREALGHTSLDVTLNNLFPLMWAVESKIQKGLQENPNFSRAVIYVGQAKDINSRFSGHKSDVADAVLQLQKNKSRWVSGALKEHENHYVKMYYLIKNIPLRFINVFEALVAHLFSVQEFKGSGSIATSGAWKLVRRYLDSDARQEMLNRENLIDYAAVERKLLRDTILPFEHPW